MNNNYFEINIYLNVLQSIEKKLNNFKKCIKKTLVTIIGQQIRPKKYVYIM